MIKGILRRAGRVRGEEPAFVGHIGHGTAPRFRGLLRPDDRVIDLEDPRGHATLTPPADLDGDSVPAGFAAVIAGSATDLRRAVTLSDWLPAAPYVAVVINTLPAHWGPPLPAQPGQNQWRHLEDMHVRRHPGGAWTLELFFLEPVPVGEVVTAVARSLGGSRHAVASATPAPLVALTGEEGEAGPAAAWRPGDPGVTAAPPSGPVRTVRVSPAADLALRADGAAPRQRPAWTDERAVVVDRPGPAALTRAHLDPTAGTGHLPEPERLEVDDVPPVDERTVNPVGFAYYTQPDIARLTQRGDRWVLLNGTEELLTVPESGTITDADLGRLRQLRGVSVEWGNRTGPVAAVRAVAGLAAGGVPLLSGPVPPWAACLGAELRESLGAVSATDLADEVVREEHSVRLRRAALRAHGARARWRRLGARLGVPQPPEPRISVILCTRRPDMVGFGLRQIARQRLVNVEAVLTLHGFGAEAPSVREAIAEFRESGRHLVVYEAEDGTVYGDALNQSVSRASGSLIAKMDDDDWYSPEHLADMLLAREYSGADITGCGQEFVYLEELDLMVRRRTVCERAWRFVAGGGFLVDRGTLEEVGGFRPLPRAIDSQLFTAVTKNGGRVYRTHSLGYVLRRKAEGHTWLEGVGYFLRGTARQWQGWRPSALLEADPRDEPERGAGVPNRSAQSEQTRQVTGART